MFARSVMSLHGGSTDELRKVLLIQSPVRILRIPEQEYPSEKDKAVSAVWAHKVNQHGSVALSEAIPFYSGIWQCIHDKKIHLG